LEKKVCIIADPADAYATGNVIRVDVDTEIKNMKRELWYLDEWQQEMIDQECPAEEFFDKKHTRIYELGYADSCIVQKLFFHYQMETLWILCATWIQRKAD
jgi:hypothetical protein